MRIIHPKDFLLQNQTDFKVNINSFKAIVNGSTVTCIWVIVPEIWNNYFILERSFDNINFKAVALAFGIDAGIVENCGLIKISLLQSASNALEVLPNPFATNFKYKLIAPSTGYIITKIINLGGRLMATKHTAVTKGYNNLAVDDLAGFCCGVYIIEVIMNGSIIGRQKINKV